MEGNKVIKKETEETSIDETIFKPSEGYNCKEEYSNKYVGKIELEELNKLKSEVECAYREYMKKKLQRSALKKAACESMSQFSEVSQKAQQIIAAQKLASVADLNFGECEDPLMILGLEEHHKRNSETKISYSEKILISPLVENNLLGECSRIQKYKQRKEDRKFSQKVKSLEDIAISEQFKMVASAKSQYEKLYKEVQTMRDLMIEISDIRLDCLHKMKTEAVPWLEAKCESLELEAKTLEMEIMLHMMMEKEHIPDAINEIDEYSYRMYEEKKEELEKLKHDEKAYKDLEHTEYDEVLKNYKQYKKELYLKEWILDEL
ncbi:uncharacterized protein PF3D7_1120000-like [Periplaneta americana]|uniref:uncharacterized protein PF3D7_1120000-like n=1 Tax=Periplaneta americana TaxID=6978 RepID=UPI0037E973CD